jgi:UDP-GlcNAc:undecaprenyl-phosphate/decaprenyl-phosphate GlcNAc-1-phosphate transferase
VIQFLPVAISFGFSLLLIPLVRRLSFRLGKVAKPREDRWHRKPTPTLGGIGIFIAFCLALFINAYLENSWGRIPWGVVAGSGAIFILGLYDDLKQLTPPAKLGGQILAATLVISFGYTTTFFTSRISNIFIAQVPNILLTYIWLIGITNAINLLDNMDGLAGGISFITAAILAYLFWGAGSGGFLSIALALVGAVLGFLVFNFPPASIFMGDSGSLFLGFTLASLAIAHQPQASNVFAVMGVPTLIFLLPILDTSLVTFTRILRGQSPAQGGRDHTSHRLIAFGFNERQAVLALYAVAIISGLAGITLESLAYWYSLVLMPALVISLAVITAYLGGLKVVVPPSDPSQKPLTRFILELTYRRRLLEVILDFFLIGVVYYLSFLTNFGFVRNAGALRLTLRTLPIAFGGAYISFFVFGVYRGVWRYTGLEDLVRYAKAALGGVLLTSTTIYLLYSREQYPPEIFLLFAVFLFLGLAVSRSSFRLLDQISGRQAHTAEERVLIIGASDSGEMALRWIRMNPQLKYEPVGFIDTDPLMVGRQIHGVEVLGDLRQLGNILERSHINGVILTATNFEGDNLRQTVLTTCQNRGCWVRNLRLEFEPVE